MPESPLEKLLRLTGGTTKSYTHVVRGRPVAVHQYPTPHPAHGRVPAGSLRVGQVVQIKGVDYTVIKVNIVLPVRTPAQKAASKAAAAKGRAARTAAAGGKAATKATASAGQGVSTAAGPNFKQSPQVAALAGITVPKGAPVTRIELRCVATKAVYFATLPKSLMLAVVG